MSNTKTTKRALFSSIMAMLLCVVMLIGATFAWFTDSASTAVNKIQSGTLNVGIEMATAWNENGTPIAWEDAEGKTLNFRKASGVTENETILWEPGCTYKLPELRIVNKGNLALKYQIVITGIVGDAKLNEAIEWEWYGYTGEHIEENIGRGDILTSESMAITGTIIPDENGDIENLLISGHMKKDAGNEYQGLSIEGVSITVVATQYTYEEDSFDNTYDETALYPEIISTNEEAQGAIISDKNGVQPTGDVNVVTTDDITLDLDANGGYYNATIGGTDSENVTIDAKGNKIIFDSDYRNAINCYGKLTISNAELDSTYKTEGSTWDDYSLLFRYNEGGANEVVFNNVVFDRQVAIEKGVKATFNNCTINQTAATGDMYALWICAGADVTLNSCTINSINPNVGSYNRAIKIADQYIDTPTLTMLSVSGTTFSSQKKAAVLVTSTAGANIVWGEGNDISAVAADTVNAVWNDSSRTSAWDLVTVTGCTKYQETD